MIKRMCTFSKLSFAKQDEYSILHKKNPKNKLQLQTVHLYFSDCSLKICILVSSKELIVLLVGIVKMALLGVPVAVFKGGDFHAAKSI